MKYWGIHCASLDLVTLEPLSLLPSMTGWKYENNGEQFKRNTFHSKWLRHKEVPGEKLWWPIELGKYSWVSWGSILRTRGLSGSLWISLSFFFPIFKIVVIYIYHKIYHLNHFKVYSSVVLDSITSSVEGIWANSRRQWRTEESDGLPSMGSHKSRTRLSNWTTTTEMKCICYVVGPSPPFIFIAFSFCKNQNFVLIEH